MQRFTNRTIPFLFMLMTFLFPAKSLLAGDGKPQQLFSWDQLPSIPDSVGLAGPFGGIANGALLIAGGANFPAGMPWDGGVKAWHDAVYVLESPTSEWELAGRLPHPLAYGVSVSTSRGLLCIGGGDSARHYSDVFLLKWENGNLETVEMPALPEPMAFGSGVQIGSKVYVAGGLSAPGAPEPMKTFWVLDMAASAGNMEWKQLESWPGTARMLSVAGTQEDDFFLISGANLVPDASGGPVREFLKDAYRYDTETGTWTRIADLPRAAVAAANPAVNLGQAHLLVFGGDDGSLFFRQQELKDDHPGFSSDILAYHTVTDTWVAMGEIEAGIPPVTTVTARWNGQIIIPSGEIRPGVRSPSVLAATPLEKRAGFALLDISILVVYFIILIGIGIYYASRERSTNDYFLGGNRIPWWAAGLSIFGTQLSAITFLSIPAKTYESDWVFFFVNMTIVAVAPIIIYRYLPFFHKLKITSAYEYLEKRFSLPVRLIGGLSFLLFQFGRMGIVIFLPSLALNAVMDINIFLCIVLIGGLSMIYTFLGGIEADIWNDVFQVVLLLGGALLSLVLIATQVDGGISTIVSTGMEAGKFKMANFSWDITTDALWVVIIGSFFGNMVSYTSDQAVVQRYLTTETPEKAAKSIWTNAILTIPATVIFFSVGTALWVFYKTKPELLDPMSQSDDIFPWFIAQQLPPGVSGLVIAGVFAAAMSTLDSSMNSMSAVITTDFYKRLKPGATDKQHLKVARYVTLALGLVGITAAIYMAMLDSASMWDQYLKVVGLFGGGLAGMFLAGVFTRRIHAAGILTGFFTSAIVLLLVQTYTDIHFFLYAAIGMLTCFAVGWLVSMIVPGKIADEQYTYRSLK
ncbi:SSS family transporter [Anseongella ginsenosidimutans]|uniref:SSS family transporter n=1 Tax=Anseongella ginsenosidimutans TaxID=496056 RepID=A0A4V2UTF6_9SPHI|nr:sodium/solute symporter [Anseongella ginsenosidimutans]QEC52402.1 sodium/solute symporter [Anseongella ginsenosidimutans]TCS85855.1 SSS family transporter [Anseongella ginsenosidimutans]